MWQKAVISILKFDKRNSKVSVNNIKGILFLPFLQFLSGKKGIFHKMKLLFFLIFVPLINGDRIVTTKTGPIRGTSIAEKKVEAFLGIPYAEPPVGHLRFAKPVPKSPWRETYEANQLPPSCVQADFKGFYFAPQGEMREDCLYLNLWVPEGGSDLKTIMLFIHGGGFMIGSTNMKLYDGATLSERGDVIVATINYRVGTLGFFSGFIDEAEGSMGMYDQVMAIQWIKDNAKYFRGDPDNIVLMGESAGAFSVSFHMISPLSKNLFKRGILQSGSALSPVYSDGNEYLFNGSQAIATLLGCADDNESLKKNPKGVVDCMKNLPAEKFSEADRAFYTNSSAFIPRVGNDFLPMNPIDLYQKSNFKVKDVLLGITRDEGTFLLTSQRPDIFGTFGEKADTAVFNDTLAEDVMKIIHLMGQQDGSNEIIRHYLNRVKNEKRYTYLNAMSDIVGDFYFNCAAVFQADYQSKDTPVYFYSFDYRSSSTPLAEWMGSAHFDELQYMFGNPMHQSFTEHEEEISRDIMDMWIAFAKTGNPTIPGGLKWPRYTYEDPKYYIINTRDSIGVRPDNYRCEVWREKFRSVIDD